MPHAWGGAEIRRTNFPTFGTSLIWTVTDDSRVWSQIWAGFLEWLQAGNEHNEGWMQGKMTDILALLQANTVGFGFVLNNSWISEYLSLEVSIFKNLLCFNYRSPWRLLWKFKPCETSLQKPRPPSCIALVLYFWWILGVQHVFMVFPTYSVDLYI